MRKTAFLSVLALLSLTAIDFPALPDGGALVTPTDAGSSVTIDTGHTEDWVPLLRCHSELGSPRAYYRFSGDAGVARAGVDSLLALDIGFDLPVIQQRNRGPLRWVSFLGEDGGVPACTLHQPTEP